MGYSIASAPIISFHYGAGNREELKNLFKKEFDFDEYYIYFVDRCSRVKF